MNVAPFRFNANGAATVHLVTKCTTRKSAATHLQALTYAAV